MDFLIEPLHYGFMIRGLLGGLVTAAACAILSAFVVWRGMSFMGDALAHSVLPGIVVAYILGISLIWGAMAAAALVVVGIGLISSRGKLREDTAIGVVFTGFFALGILMLSRVATFSDLSHILFGNILGVTRQDLVLMALVTVVVVAGTILSFKENCHGILRPGPFHRHRPLTVPGPLYRADDAGPHHRCRHSDRRSGFGSGSAGDSGRGGVYGVPPAVAHSSRSPSFWRPQQPSSASMGPIIWISHPDRPSF